MPSLAGWEGSISITATSITEVGAVPVTHRVLPSVMSFWCPTLGGLHFLCLWAEEGAIVHVRSSPSTPSVDWRCHEARQKSKTIFFRHLKKQRQTWCLTKGQSFQILKSVHATLPFFLGIRCTGLIKTRPLSASPSLNVYKEKPTHSWGDLIWIDFEYHQELCSISHRRVSCWWAASLH